LWDPLSRAQSRHSFFFSFFFGGFFFPLAYPHFGSRAQSEVAGFFSSSFFSFFLFELVLGRNRSLLSPPLGVLWGRVRATPPLFFPFSLPSPGAMGGGGMIGLIPLLVLCARALSPPKGALGPFFFFSFFSSLLLRGTCRSFRLPPGADRSALRPDFPPSSSLPPGRRRIKNRMMFCFPLPSPGWPGCSEWLVVLPSFSYTGGTRYGIARRSRWFLFLPSFQRAKLVKRLETPLPWCGQGGVMLPSFSLFPFSFFGTGAVCHGTPPPAV